MTRHTSHLATTKTQSSHAQIAPILGVVVLTGRRQSGASPPPFET